ncbi:hypothetical protein RB595_007674 [Gaeumannomyces hyphopodioides]
MQFSIFTIIAAAAAGVAARNQACGYHLVNSGAFVQADIAWAVCGRTDTCDGREWHTVFAYNLVADPNQPIIKALSFCDKGCHEIPTFHDGCN